MEKNRPNDFFANDAYKKEVKNNLLLEIINFRDFPSGTVVKNPPANAGDMGSIPDPGRSHMPQSS